MLFNINIRGYFIQIGLECLKTKCITRLMLPIIIKILLETVVRQMYICISVNVMSELSTRSPQIPLFVIVDFIRSFECPNSNIELSLVIEQRLFQILLNHPFRTLSL